jgi:hypothetical protein
MTDFSADMVLAWNQLQPNGSIEGINQVTDFPGLPGGYKVLERHGRGQIYMIRVFTQQALKMMLANGWTVYTLRNASPGGNQGW